MSLFKIFSNLLSQRQFSPSFHQSLGNSIRNNHFVIMWQTVYESYELYLHVLTQQAFLRC